MEETWECHNCNWFILIGALKFQKKLGIQAEPWTCPECKGLLTKKKCEKINGDLEMAPEDRAIQDAYWEGVNENPYEHGTPEHHRYEDAFKSETERLAERREEAE
jgi:hypothetical protein